MGDFGDFDIDYNKWESENNEVDRLQKEFDGLQPSDPRYAEVKQQLEEKTQLRDISQEKALGDLEDKIGIERGVFKKINLEDLGDLSKGATKEDIAKVKKYIKDNFDKVATKIAKLFDVGIGTRLFEVETFVDKDGKTQYRVKDTPENRITVREVCSKLWDIVEKNPTLFRFIFGVLILWGGYVLVMKEIVDPILCNFAKTQSGCFAINPKDGKLTPVTGLINEPTTINCYDYGDCCGGCDKGYLQTGVQELCCTKLNDPDANDHPNAQYTYQCVSPAGALLNFAKWLGDLFPSPDTLTKWLKPIAIGIAIIFGTVIMFYVVKYGISRIGNKKEGGKEGGKEGSDSSDK